MVQYTSSPKHSLPSSFKNQHSLAKGLLKYIFSAFQNVLHSNHTETQEGLSFPPPSKNTSAGGLGPSLLLYAPL